MQKSRWQYAAYSFKLDMCINHPDRNMNEIGDVVEKVYTKDLFRRDQVGSLVEKI